MRRLPKDVEKAPARIVFKMLTFSYQFYGVNSVWLNSFFFESSMLSPFLNAVRATAAGQGCHLLHAQARGQPRDASRGRRPGWQAEAAARRMLGRALPAL